MAKAAAKSDLIEQLVLVTDVRARRKLLDEHTGGHPANAIPLLYDEVLKLSRVDLQRASQVADVLFWLAEDLGDDTARAQAFRARGHIFYFRGYYAPAVESYTTATRLFECLSEELEVARTINAALQSLIYLSRYDDALASAERARNIFEKYNDAARLGRLDSNVANIYYRQDRLHEALELYRRAHERLSQCPGEADYVALNLRNLAVCHVSLGQFEEALATYREARDYCATHDMPLVVSEADYNIAYLYYLRGEYTEAIALYEATRERCDQTGDRYHRALCDLDQSEMYLELNLIDEGADLAARAYGEFRELHMGYEAAKAMTFLAIAGSEHNPARALQRFDAARELFLEESNHFWPALIDLYKALVLFEEQEYARARDLCLLARSYFQQSPAMSKAAICELLLARLDLATGDPAAARAHCDAAMGLLQMVESPALVFEADFVLGQVLEASGDRTQALLRYEQAHRSLERLRSHLHAEGLKIAFLKDKLQVYEGLVCLLLDGQNDGREQRLAFEFIERAKSRSLADMIAFRLNALSPRGDDADQLTQRLHWLSQTTTWTRQQAHRTELQADAETQARAQRLRQQSQAYEDQLASVVDELRRSDRDLASLLNAGAVPLEAVQEQIRPDAVLLEYYEARGTIYACLLGRKTLKVLPVAPARCIREEFRFLHFQLSKFRLGKEYLGAFSAPLLAATNEHLRHLYQQLIAPVRDYMQADHAVIVPHGFLHHLPFHALTDGSRALIDNFSLSYAPSAAVYQLCCTKPRAGGEQALVMGIPDALAPFIVDEVRSVAGVLPNARLFIGDEATDTILKENAPGSRFVHIATHGLFRQDNPMFSSIRLGKTDLSLYDLYQLRLSAELVTLSGCGTGLNVVVAGDELLGLVRGLLYAGAQSVLVTLWDVNDASTAEFMKMFYQRLSSASNKAAALRQTMIEMREAHVHPYFWAPFLLVGQYA
ncbi:MAG: CHAT domain-containing protein [Terriglobales bacterium]